MVHTCSDCGETFESDAALTEHVEAVHGQRRMDSLITLWKTPWAMFLFGLVAGLILVGSVAVTPNAIFQQTSAEEVGQQVVNHYQEKAPPGVTYALDAVDSYDAHLYAVTIEVRRGTTVTDERVYVTKNGRWAFTGSPERVRADVTALAD